MIVPSLLIETSTAIAHLPSVDWAASSGLLPALSQALTNPPMVPTPISFVSTILLVTGSDMIPFLPCQPLAITLGATYGVWAYPMCVIGQTMAGVLAFRAARLASDSEPVLELLENNLNDEAKTKFQEFKNLGTTQQESQVLLALIGLRLAPFFPFSAGNYLLGAGTGVGLRPFLLATILGCLLSNLLSISVGIGGSELFQQS
jgi:uncharacterized membrane protein YdjX (TVP38/TMEM64 family)